VLQNQTALAQAESTLVSASAAYEKSRVEQDRATGLLLDHSGILVADAERGEVSHMPNIPFVTPRANPTSVMPTAPQQPTPQNEPQQQPPQGQPEQQQAPPTQPPAN
jgi:hypothetical protein